MRMLRPRALLRHATGLLLLVAAICAARAQAPEDAIIARVNSEALLLSQLKEAALDQEVPVSSLLLDGVKSPAYRKALTQIVDEMLLVQHAKNEGLKPNDMAIARDVDQMIAELRTQMGSQERLDDFLAQHHLTLDTLRTLMTERERKRTLSTEVVAKRVVVDDAAVEKFTRERQAKGLSTDEVNLAQVLADCPAADRAKHGEARRAAAMKAAREAGALKLDALPGYIRRVNQLGDASVHGVALGWVDPASLIPALSEQLKKMQPGEVSQPIETDQGYHVLIVLGRHGARDLAFIEEFAKVRERLLTDLRREASIQLYDLQGRQIKVDMNDDAPAAPKP